MTQAASAGNLSALNGSFRRILRAEDKSERTVKSYTEAVRLFADFLAGRGHSLRVDAITRDHVRAFVADQLERWKPLTALNRYRGLHAFLRTQFRMRGAVCVKPWQHAETVCYARAGSD